MTSKWAKGTGGPGGDECQNLVAHSLRADGFDASEDGTGRGTPLVAVDYTNGLLGEIAGTLEAAQSKGNRGHGVIAYRTSPNCGAWETGDRTDALTTGTDPSATVVAFQQNSRSEVRILGEDGSKVGALSAESGMNQTNFVAFNLRGRDGGAMPESVDPASLRAASGGSSRSYVATFDERGITSPGNRSAVDPAAPCHTLHSAPPSIIGQGVRRLTPQECEKLQGFPPGWTEWIGAFKRQKDGPRYKQLGNAVTVNVAEWIGQRVLEFLPAASAPVLIP